MIGKIKNRLRHKYLKFTENTLPYYCYKSGILSSFYYTLFSPAFRREHRGVLAGKVKHLEEEGNYYLLVRNIHRLEKGLLMRPRRSSFGNKFIKETVYAYSQICGSDLDFSNNHQLKWFHDVLERYFEVVTPDNFITPLKQKFDKIVGDYSQPPVGKSKIPYGRRVEEFSSITFDEFYKLTIQRRSVRWFQDKKVPRHLVDKAILAASQSPSACNRQPFEYRIIDDPELIKTVVNLPMGTAGYGHSIPVMIIAVGNLDAYFSERDRHLIYIDASLANMTLMLALETLGLSSCSINWPDIENREKQMAEFLNLESYQRPVMCIGLGYPDMEGLVAYSEKRELNVLRKFN